MKNLKLTKIAIWIHHSDLWKWHYFGVFAFWKKKNYWKRELTVANDQNFVNSLAVLYLFSYFYCLLLSTQFKKYNDGLQEYHFHQAAVSTTEWVSPVFCVMLWFFQLSPREHPTEASWLTGCRDTSQILMLNSILTCSKCRLEPTSFLKTLPSCALRILCLFSFQPTVGFGERNFYS